MRLPARATSRHRLLPQPADEVEVGQEVERLERGAERDEQRELEDVPADRPLGQVLQIAADYTPRPARLWMVSSALSRRLPPCPRCPCAARRPAHRGPRPRGARPGRAEASRHRRHLRSGEEGGLHGEPARQPRLDRRRALPLAEDRPKDKTAELFASRPRRARRSPSSIPRGWRPCWPSCRG